jgi:hypothetical protein
LRLGVAQADADAGGAVADGRNAQAHARAAALLLGIVGAAVLQALDVGRSWCGPQRKLLISHQ